MSEPASVEAASTDAAVRAPRARAARHGQLAAHGTVPAGPQYPNVVIRSSEASVADALAAEFAPLAGEFECEEFAVNAPLDIAHQVAMLREKFDVILVDPPTRFVTRSERGQRKSASQKYPVMSFAELAAIPLASVAAVNCYLAVWATQAMLPETLALMSEWGFAFKSSGSWAKQSKTGKKWHFGTGYILRSASEPYLIGTRGSPKQAVHNVRNLIVAPVREHSRKPEQMHADLERMFPNARRLELFGRQSRPGWLVLGNEATKFDRPEGAR